MKYNPKILYLTFAKINEHIFVNGFLLVLSTAKYLQLDTSKQHKVKNFIWKLVELSVWYYLAPEKDRKDQVPRSDSWIIWLYTIFFQWLIIGCKGEKYKIDCAYYWIPCIPVRVEFIELDNIKNKLIHTQYIQLRSRVWGTARVHKPYLYPSK